MGRLSPWATESEPATTKPPVRPSETLASETQTPPILITCPSIKNLSMCLLSMLCLIALLCLTLATPWTITHQAPLTMGILQARLLEWVATPSSRASSRSRDGTQVFRIAGKFFSLHSEPPGKPQNTGVGSPSLLQGFFLSQEWNQGLLPCRWIPSQLSHQGSPLWSIHLSVCPSVHHLPMYPSTTEPRLPQQEKPPQWEADAPQAVAPARRN